MRELLAPRIFVVRPEAISRRSRVPNVAGVYAWYFNQAPSGVPLEGTHVQSEWHLLYVGISPRRPRLVDGKPSSGKIRRRIRTHYGSDASRSTLRFSLGALLCRDLDLQLQLSDQSGRWTFGPGETRLSAWMATHTKVCWLEHAEPWLVEDALIATVPLALNLDSNSSGYFYSELRSARAALRDARQVTL
ncbi:GIY-YIG nuclease family protein [Microcella sp.]|uniref:GIY-YIG nuclease family protein n=1 Tax=Microcella sp. TaxID=1913979 RepID=UPI0025660413|nr:hypothetical protein [Microcella sp.]MBX9470379.1 hypothetical protein [Microcella sp.]